MRRASFQVAQRRRGVGVVSLAASSIATAGLAAVVACSAAPEGVAGGEARFDTTPPRAPETGCAKGTGATWSELYRDCFGPGHADCGGTVGCHSSAADTGTNFSGFLCKQTKDDCYAGMVGQDKIVPLHGSMTPETTRLFTTLRKAPDAGAGGTMPKNSGFDFDEQALQRIRTWIQNGAKND